MNRLFYDEKNERFRRYTDDEVVIQKIRKGKGKNEKVKVKTK